MKFAPEMLNSKELKEEGNKFYKPDGL